MNTLKSITSSNITINQSINTKTIKYIILFFSFVIIFFYLHTNFLFPWDKTKIFDFEKAFSNYLNKDQLNYCGSENIKIYTVADFFVCSSFNPISRISKKKI